METVRFFIRVWTYWIVYFLVFKLTFLLYHHNIYLTFSGGKWLQMFGHGFAMDVSMASYLSILPLVFWVGRWLYASSVWLRLATLYRIVILLIAGLALTADLEVFASWGHRIDALAIRYLAYPREALASASAAPFRILFTVYGLSFVLGAMLWTAFHGKFIQQLSPPTWKQSAVGILLTGLLIIPIRGGFQLAPINQSTVHFSANPMLNYGAENALWGLLQSLLETDQDREARMETGTEEESLRMYETLFPQSKTASAPILSTQKPNVVLIIWESLTTKVVGSLGGKFPSTPNLDRLSRDGLLFTRMYANGDRSDKGLASLLSAVPAIDQSSIMNRHSNLGKLPHISRILKKNGYKTAFMYGGELEFANLKSYLLFGEYDQLIGKSEFKKEELNSKWGAHDEALFSRQLEVAQTSGTPFFHALFTLSSHEPFEIPGEKPDPNLPHDTLFCRSHRYTDRCLAGWVKQAEKQAWWNNTLVIVVADHGHTAPGQTPNTDPEKFRIPMLWFGPALRNRGLNPMMGSQTDLASTLLHQLGLEGLPFSADLLDSATVPKAFFGYEGGFTLLRGDSQSLADDAGKPVGNDASFLRRRIFDAYYR